MRTRVRGMRSAHVALGAVLAAAIMIAPAAEAWAHAKLRRAVPAPGSTVTVAPKVVRAWFNEELDARRSVLTVWDARGRRADDGKGGVDLNDMDRASMVAKLIVSRPGPYTVRWTAVSADDSFVARGTFRFTVKPR